MNESTRIIEESRENVGAGVMGRDVFGPVRGGLGRRPVDGLVGRHPSYHCPVFVVTHHPRDPVEMEGGTTFHFVTDGIESALEQAKVAAGGKDVMLWGGGNIAQQYLATVQTGRATGAPRCPSVARRRALASSTTSGTGRCSSSRSQAIEAPGVTHLKYRVVT